MIVTYTTVSMAVQRSTMNREFGIFHVQAIKADEYRISWNCWFELAFFIISIADWFLFIIIIFIIIILVSSYRLSNNSRFSKITRFSSNTHSSLWKH